jgi:DHA1 family multidrug resistance protein-like MFS transporter
MGAFLPLFINSELKFTLIKATYWTGISQLITALLMAFTAPFWGFMCDKVGTKKIILIGLTGNTIAYAGMAVSTNLSHIIFFRVVQGIFGGLSTAMFALVASVVSGKALRVAISYQMVAATLGGLIGPGIGGMLAYTIGYRLTFASSSFLYVIIIFITLVLKIPPSAEKKTEKQSIRNLNIKAIIPDILTLIFVYACISFISPTISWFLESLGVPFEQLLIFTAFVRVLNGLAFVVATPVLTKFVTYKTLPILPAAAAAVIFMTTFVMNPYQFIALRILIGAIQAGIPPNLFGGKTRRRGTTMGFLNSARFMGLALGPFMATSILGNGEPLNVFYMFTAMTGMSLLASLTIYLTNKRETKTKYKTNLSNISDLS